MNKFAIAALLTVASSLYASTAAATEVETSVSEVIVYTDGALVTRSAILNLVAGEQQIELTGLPSNLDAETLRLEVNNKGVRVGQVNIKVNEFIESTDPVVVSLKDKIAVKGNQIRQLQDSSNAAQLQLKFLDSLATGYSKQAWIGSAQGSADVVSWQKALGLMQSGSEAANKIIRKNILSVSRLNSEMSLLQRELSDKRSLKASNSSVFINLSSNELSKAVVKVHYLQDQAGWGPSYEARLSSADGKLLLAQKAVLWQGTEEAWPNAKVTLSTSQPSQQMQAPKLNSQFFDLREKPRPVQARRSKAYASAPMASSQAGDREAIVVAGTKRVAEWSGSYSQNFPIAGRISVSNNDDETQRYDLEIFEFSVKLVTQITPMQSTQAYLSARFTHAGKTPIYGDQMLVYVDGVLMGSAQMPTILPGAEVTLPMGIDRRIEVKVDNLGGLGGHAGVIKKQVTDSTDLVFEITNRRSSLANIEVRAVYPVSKNKALKITIGDNATPATESNVDGNTGVALWQREVKAGETWSINYNVSRTRPADRDLRRVYN